MANHYSLKEGMEVQGGGSWKDFQFEKEKYLLVGFGALGKGIFMKELNNENDYLSFQALDLKKIEYRIFPKT
jgi:hypothetical protein